MGWCSGTYIFDDTIKAAEKVGITGDKLTAFAENVIRAFEDHDWDCQPDSVYWNKPGPVWEAFRKVHSQWVKDVESEEND